MVLTHLLSQIFIEPVVFRGVGRLLMLVPLALSISVTYKTLHCARLADVPLASLRLWLTILVGMMSIGAGLLIVFRLLA